MLVYVKRTNNILRFRSHIGIQTEDNVYQMKIRLTNCLIVLLLILVTFTATSQQQAAISLTSARWFVSNSNSSIVVPAQVPGGIYSDLRRANVLKQDILYGKNDVAYRWVGNENWTYTTSFAIDHQIARSQSVKLVLHGIDTIARVFINNHEVGSTDNMFIRYKFDIKPQLKLVGLENLLEIKFESPVKYSARQSHQSIRDNRGKIIPPYCPSAAQKGECHVNFIRKMQASFSWDWGPAFPSVGLYKDITLEFGSFGLIRDILVETRRLPPLVQPAESTTPAPQIVISSSIRQQLKKPTINKTMPYVRAPPYYIGMNNDNLNIMMNNQPQVIDSSLVEEAHKLLEENWLLKVTLVAEMVQPNFGYNIRIEFNINNVLHYESEHINVVANSEGYIRLGFNLRVDTSRLHIKPWWPNNAGSQTLYKLSARMMPLPSPGAPPEHIRIQPERTGRFGLLPDTAPLPLQYRSRPPRSPAVPPLAFLSTQFEASQQSVSQYVSAKEISFGFRTVELIQEPVTPTDLEDGLTFNFRVNGVDLFAMGSNWIPSSILPENSNDFEYIRYLLQSAKDANMNMLRVWGGGLYESDEFYKMADEMGIMIWHDMMFACALYPSDEEFLASVRTEIEQQVQRLQYHPSIVLWAGNNENEMAIAGPWWPEVLVWNKKLKESYSTLYVDTIRPIVQILDPTRPYVESSPSNGLSSKASQYSIARLPNDNKYGDVHHYDYLADSFNWNNYPSTRFASEYGFQSYPSFNALSSISAPNDWKYPLTSNILHRQHRLTGETEIKLQIKMHFNEPDSGGVDKFKTFIYTSQLTQAIAIKTETEFYRRNRFIDPETKLGKTMGALYWQLNDVWQAPTWSSIEYGGKWKMLHYFARRFFFPIQLIPYLTQPPSPSAASSSGSSAGFSSAIQQLSSLLPYQTRQYQLGDLQQQQQQQQQQSGSPLFVLDLVRDDLFYQLDSFNVTIRFFRWTSFAPVWQDTVYVKNTRPQNVTRIYEQDLSRILRPISASGGVFQVIIEQQPRLGLSQIDNYLMPVNPSRVTAMRVAKINVELIQGPFELTEVKNELSQSNYGSSSQWSCAYRLTLVSDAIAMFVWLDLNLLNVTSLPLVAPPQRPAVTLDEQVLAGTVTATATTSNQHRPPPPINAVPSAPANIHLDTLPSSVLATQLDSSSNNRDRQQTLSQSAPESIRLHFGQPAIHQHQHHHHQHQHHHQVIPNEREQSAPNLDKLARRARWLDEPFKMASFSARSGATIGDNNNNNNNNHQQQHHYHARRPSSPTYKPVDSMNNAVRYQFSDNAFNMFEASKVIDLYLSRCLDRVQIESALEIKSLSDSL